MYLLDYGLAYRFKPSGNHVPYKEDPKRKHDGTIEYTSRDAHKGCGMYFFKMLSWKFTELECLKTGIRDLHNLSNFNETIPEIESVQMTVLLFKICFKSQDLSYFLPDYSFCLSVSVCFFNVKR